MKEAEQKEGHKTLKNHRTYKKLWPTPRASEIMHQKLTPKLAARAKDYGNLEEAVSTTMWPTPATSNSRGAVKNRFMGSETYRGNLDKAVRTHQEDMHLSANWVEWLMGYPPGWTNLPESPEQDLASKEELPD